MKKFVQRLFGGSKEKQQSSPSNQPQTKSIAQSKQQTSYDYGELLDRVRALQEQGRYKSALENLFPLLESNPQDEDVSFLASFIIYLSQSPSDHVYDASEPLTSEHLGDRRLDHLFCECNRCRSTWMPSPIPFGTSWNAPGGQCPKCGRVFCQACSTAPGNSNYICPECSTILSGVEKPNGRKSVQAKRRKEKVSLVIVFREGPIPPDDQYLTKLFRHISPDILEDKPEIKAFPIHPWPKNNSKVRQMAVDFCNSQVPDVIPPNTIEEDFFFLREDDSTVFLMKYYGKLRSDNPEPWEAFKQKVSIRRDAPDSDIGNMIRFVFVFDSEAQVNWVFSKLPEHILSELVDNKESFYRSPDLGGKCLITFDPVTLTFRQAKDVMNLVVLQGGEIYEALIS